MKQHQLDLIYAFIGVWTDGSGPWSSVAQEPTNPLIEKAIPKMWAIAAHVDDDRGVDDQLVDMYGEDVWESMGDETRQILGERATDGWLAFLVAKATVQLMGGPIIIKTTEDEFNAETKRLEGKCFDLYDVFVRTGMVVR